MGDDLSKKFIGLLTRYLGDNMMSSSRVIKDKKVTGIIIPRKSKNASWNMNLSVDAERNLVIVSSSILSVIRDRIRDARELLSYINGTSFLTSWVFDEDELEIIAHSYYIAPSENFSGLPLVLDDHVDQIDKWANAWYRLNSTNQHPKRIFMAALKAMYVKEGEDGSDGEKVE